ncbi:carboxypeptidase-like regulatory domain-containing protein [Plantactinospora sp. B6F1]|uniref:carboxypeptidase regulatory-like domain-containing protein n=1 Tax=Plantactinospora sp. B6F1 TaxID=3158971 RepID=UPI00102CF6E5
MPVALLGRAGLAGTIVGALLLPAAPPALAAADTGTITGQIRDSAGNPVSDLLIAFDGREHPYAGYATTDTDGRYEFTTPADSYTVSFSPVPGSPQAQYVPGKIDHADATWFDVTAGGNTVVDDTLLGTGGISGRLTTASGAPLADASVEITTSRGSEGGTSTTDGEGRFEVSQLLTGSYLLAYSHDGRYQYYKGKRSPETADRIIVTANQDSEVTDSLLPVGSIRISAVDADTAQPIASFCADDWCSNGTGTVTIPDRPTQPHRFSIVTPRNLYLATWTDWITPVPDQTVEVTVALRKPAWITATVVDRTTGHPLADMCVHALPAKGPRLPDGYGICSNSAGQVRIGPLEPGSYNLFAEPVGDRSYGRQWVGATGGTGDQRAAVTVVASSGSTVAGPTVRLDRAGSISGRVTDEQTGTPLANVRVSLLGYHPGTGPPGSAVTDSDGRYEVTGLGPYAWPLFFNRNGFGQWAGGVPNRYRAAATTVTVGTTSGYDMSMRPGTEVRGTFSKQDSRPFGSGWVLVHNHVTGDIVGSTWLTNGQYSLRVLPRQPIHLSYNVSDEQRSYDGPYLRCTATGPAVSAGQNGGVPHNRRPKPAVFKVPSTGTLTADIVLCAG